MFIFCEFDYIFFAKIAINSKNKCYTLLPPKIHESEALVYTILNGFA